MLKINMQQRFTEEQKQRYESYLNIHLKKNQLGQSIPKQIEALKKRDRNKWFHFVINVAAILLFGYSFYYEITRLSRTFFIIIVIVFSINVVLILYQKKQIKDLIDYLSWKREHE